MSNTIGIRVGGMTCGRCVGAVERALRATPGLSDVVVQVGRAGVTVASAGERERVIATALDAIRGAGYSAAVDEQTASDRTAASGCCCSTDRAPRSVMLTRGGS